MITGSTRWLAAIALGMSVFAFAPNQAAAAVCSGAYDSATATLVSYDATLDTCSISDAMSFPGINNSFGMVLNPTFEPDRYVASQFQTATGYVSPDSFIVDGIAGNAASTASAVFQNIAGQFIATILTSLNGSTYTLIANLTADGGSNITLGNITVSSVPLPAALPLFAAALGGLGLAGRRRRRKAASA